MGSGHPAADGERSEEDDEQEDRSDDGLGQDQVALRGADPAERLADDHAHERERLVDGQLGDGVDSDLGLEMQLRVEVGADHPEVVASDGDGLGSGPDGWADAGSSLPVEVGTVHAWS